VTPLALKEFADSVEKDAGRRVPSSTLKAVKRRARYLSRRALKIKSVKPVKGVKIPS
jgi:hypothetical protein